MANNIIAKFPPLIFPVEFTTVFSFVTFCGTILQKVYRERFLIIWIDKRKNLFQGNEWARMSDQFIEVGVKTEFIFCLAPSIGSPPFDGKF